MGKTRATAIVLGAILLGVSANVPEGQQPVLVVLRVHDYQQLSSVPNFVPYHFEDALWGSRTSSHCGAAKERVSGAGRR